MSFEQADEDGRLASTVTWVQLILGDQGPETPSSFTLTLEGESCEASRAVDLEQ